MGFKVLIDSCGELLPEWKNDTRFVSIPLTLNVNNYEIIDDVTFDQADFLRRVAKSPTCPKSACPSPEKYFREFMTGEDHLYAVTLSGELSGSYNSAILGRNLALEENPQLKIHVFNSRSASIGETLIGMRIQECEEQGLSFEDTVVNVEQYIDSQTTYFVLENLDTLRKNGRLSLVKSLVASALKIRPVMQSTQEGNITQIDQARGTWNAWMKMAGHIQKNTPDSQRRILAMSHCNCEERALELKRELEERLHPVRTVFLDTAGVSSMYANDGGVIVVI